MAPAIRCGGGGGGCGQRGALGGHGEREGPAGGSAWNRKAPSPWGGARTTAPPLHRPAHLHLRENRQSPKQPNGQPRPRQHYLLKWERRTGPRAGGPGRGRALPPHPPPSLRSPGCERGPPSLRAHPSPSSRRPRLQGNQAAAAEVNLPEGRGEVWGRVGRGGEGKSRDVPTSQPPTRRGESPTAKEMGLSSPRGSLNWAINACGETEAGAAVPRARQ